MGRITLEIKVMILKKRNCIELWEAEIKHRHDFISVLAAVTCFSPRRLDVRERHLFEWSSAIFCAQLCKKMQWKISLHPAISERVLHIPPIKKDQVRRNLERIRFNRSNVGRVLPLQRPIFFFLLTDDDSWFDRKSRLSRIITNPQTTLERGDKGHTVICKMQVLYGTERVAGTIQTAQGNLLRQLS